jgi:hypothetical protein
MLFEPYRSLGFAYDKMIKYDELKKLIFRGLFKSVALGFLSRDAKYYGNLGMAVHVATAIQKVHYTLKVQDNLTPCS